MGSAASSLFFCEDKELAEHYLHEVSDHVGCGDG